jgi:hypothetical protein
MHVCVFNGKHTINDDIRHVNTIIIMGLCQKHHADKRFLTKINHVFERAKNHFLGYEISYMFQLFRLWEHTCVFISSKEPLVPRNNQCLTVSRIILFTGFYGNLKVYLVYLQMP